MYIQAPECTAPKKDTPDSETNNIPSIRIGPGEITIIPDGFVMFSRTRLIRRFDPWPQKPNHGICIYQAIFKCCFRFHVGAFEFDHGTGSYRLVFRPPDGVGQESSSCEGTCCYLELRDWEVTCCSQHDLNHQPGDLYHSHCLHDAISVALIFYLVFGDRGNVSLCSKLE